MARVVVRRRSDGVFAICRVRRRDQVAAAVGGGMLLLFPVFLSLATLRPAVFLVITPLTLCVGAWLLFRNMDWANGDDEFLSDAEAPESQAHRQTVKRATRARHLSPP